MFELILLILCSVWAVLIRKDFIRAVPNPLKSVIKKITHSRRSVCQPDQCKRASGAPEWNYHKIDGQRTNNHVEGCHSRLKNVVGKAHPNVYELVEVIKREDSIATMKIQQLATGGTQAPRRRKIRERERRLETLFQRLELGSISLDEYLEAIKYHTGL